MAGSFQIFDLFVFSLKRTGKCCTLLDNFLMTLSIT